MHREYNNIFSPSLGRDMEYLRFGWSGTPIIFFPTSCGRFYDAENFGLIDALASLINGKKIQIYCVDSLDKETLYSEDLKKAYNTENYFKLIDSIIARQEAYYSYINELEQTIVAQGTTEKLIVAGCSFGAFHAANYGIKYKTQTVIGCGGSYYTALTFNALEPFQKIYNMHGDKIKDIPVFHLLCGDKDFVLKDTNDFFNMLQNKEKKHTKIIVNGDHSWATWNKMFECLNLNNIKK